MAKPSYTYTDLAHALRKAGISPEQAFEQLGIPLAKAERQKRCKPSHEEEAQVAKSDASTEPFLRMARAMTNAPRKW